MHLSNLAKAEAKEKMTSSDPKDDWPGLSRLCISIFSRSIVLNGMNTFIPLYFVGILMQTQQQGSLMLTVIAISAAAAAFTGGRIADRLGFSRVIRVTFSAVFPLIILLTLTRNVLIATAIIVPLSIMLNLGHSPSVVLGQKYLPNRLGMAAGITLGLSVSVGGISSPILGRIGDAHGLTTVLYVMAGVALLGFLGTLLLKDPGSPAAASASSPEKEATSAAAP